MFWLTADGSRNNGRHQKATPPGLRPYAPVQQPCRLLDQTSIRQGRVVVTLGCGNRGPGAPIGTPAHWTSKTVPRCQHPQRRQQRTNHYSHAIHGRFDATASQTFNSSNYKAAPDLEPGHRSLIPDYLPLAPGAPTASRHVALQDRHQRAQLPARFRLRRRMLDAVV